MRTPAVPKGWQADCSLLVVKAKVGEEFTCECFVMYSLGMDRNLRTITQKQ